MANKYPDFYILCSSLVPIVRIALIKRLDELRHDINNHAIYNRWQCVLDCVDEAKLIDDTLKDLDSHIVFDVDVEAPF